MSDAGYFGTGFCLGIGVATIVVSVCWSQASDAVTARWISFLFGVAVAGVFAGLASSSSDRGGQGGTKC